MILGIFAPGSAEWHEARRTRVGGSDLAAILGANRYESRDELMQRKAGLLPERETTAAMRRGVHLEPALIDWTADVLGVATDPAASAATYVHDMEPRWLANPDAVTTSGALIEIKTTANRATEDGWGRARTDQVPDGYAAQIQWQMGVIGAREAWLGCLHGATNGRPDLNLALYHLAYNPTIFHRLADRADAFLRDLDQLTKETQK